MRCGDVVKHNPTGEEWIVAYVDGDRLAWCGWPPGEALTSDCTLVRAATDEQHLDLLKEVAAAGCKYRSHRAKAELDKIAHQ